MAVGRAGSLRGRPLHERKVVTGIGVGLYLLPTALGLYGIERVQQFGQDDHWSWLLIPLLGVSIAASALTAIVYGLRRGPA